LERNLLVAWAQEQGLALAADDYLARVEATHGEHHVFYDAVRERYFKITHGVEHNTPGFALTVTVEFHLGKKTQRYIGVPKLREATPFEYLARLRLFNLTFQDDVQIEGVITEPGKAAIVISQRPIEGAAKLKSASRSSGDESYLHSQTIQRGFSRKVTTLVEVKENVAVRRR